MKSYVLRVAILFFLLAMLLTACSLSAEVSPPAINDTWQPPDGAETVTPVSCTEVQSLFAYDKDAPLDIQEMSRDRKDGVTLIDLTYASPMGGRVPATLIVPNGAGPFAGILYQHGMPSTRQSLIPAAMTYARMGAVVILIDAPFNRPEHTGNASLTFTEQDQLEQIQLIVDLRRAIDLLESRQDVDAQRLAFVGLSYGGAMGGLLSGVEDRIKGYVLQVGDGGLVTNATGTEDTEQWLAMPTEVRRSWVAWMWPIEPIHYVSCASPAALLFQSGTLDTTVPPADAQRYQNAGSAPKTIRWYESGHNLPPQAYRDQADWLSRIIGIASYRMAFPQNIRGALVGWFLLTALGLVFLGMDIWRTRPVPGGVYLLWFLTTALLGPLGIVVYWLASHTSRYAHSSARRALGSAAWAAAGTMTGVIIMLGLILQVQIAIVNTPMVTIVMFVMVFLIPFCTCWLALAAVSRFVLNTYHYPVRAVAGSAFLTLTGIYLTLVFLIARYIGTWTYFQFWLDFDMLYPPLWVGFNLATLAGMLATFPFHRQMIHRGLIRWNETISTPIKTQ
jgi:uncharacterized protein